MDNTVDDRFRTLVLGGIITKDLDCSARVGIDLNGVAVAVGYWGGGGEGEDTGGWESKSGESERTHCRWLMGVEESR
jgi:hypothetical protein